jgi:hypothetical protein
MPLNESRNAIELLKHDHREVESLFAEFEAESSDERKIELGRTICMELMVHTQIEEELFYPAAKQSLSDEEGQDLIAEAAVEHGSLKQLIAEIDGSSPGDEMFDARFTVLKEYVQHHVKEEENELMPEVERTDVDLEALGAQLAERKEELKSRMERARAGNGRRISLPSAPASRSGGSGRGAGGRKTAGGGRSSSSSSSGRRTSGGRSSSSSSSSSSGRKSTGGRTGTSGRKTAGARKSAGGRKTASSSRRSSGSQAGKRPAARKQTAASRQSARGARKSAPTKTSARKRAQTRRARSGRS